MQDNGIYGNNLTYYWQEDSVAETLVKKKSAIVENDEIEETFEEISSDKYLKLVSNLPYLEMIELIQRRTVSLDVNLCSQINLYIFLLFYVYNF